ncbi:MAG: DUF933 domain-containing protein [Ignavibacteriota bacterium]
MVGKTSLFTILTGVQSESRIGFDCPCAPALPACPTTAWKRSANSSGRRRSRMRPWNTSTLPSISKESLRDPSYLASLRVVDAFAHVLRLFGDETVPHEKGSVDPLRDMGDVETELILSDLMVVEKRLERLDKDRKKIKNPELDREFELLEKCKALLESDQPLRQIELDADDEKRLRGFQFLSQKPMLYVLNIGEDEAAKLHDREREYPRKGRLRDARIPPPARSAVKWRPNSPSLPREEQRDYLASYGLNESGLERLISATYSLLGLMSFLTAGEDECRAWTIPMNTPAAKAAGAIHSDFEKKFIRAEVVNWKALVDHGGYAGVREKGLLRLEGKEYIVKDGDVLVIRHS